MTQTEGARRLINNILSLSILQGVNYLLPLITLPYLVRILGPERFGLLAFATATTMYFILITDYGFNLTATRQISIHRNEKNKLSEIFSAVMIIKIALLIFSFCIMSLIVFTFENFRQNWELYFITFGMTVGQAFFPVWLFQGMERMDLIIYVNLVTKFIFTFLIFILVKESGDYLVVPLLTSASFIVTGLWSLFLVKKELDITFKRSKFSILKSHLLEGWHVFFSSISISFYTISITFILGLSTNNVVVGHFAAADKIVQAVKGLYLPISQSIFPVISKKIHKNKSIGVNFIYKITIILAPIFFIFSAILFVFSENIILLLLGQEYYSSIVILKIMSFLPFIIFMSNIFGIQTMLNLGYKKEFSFFVSIAAIIGVSMALFVAPSYQAIGVSVVMLLVELLITLMLGFFVFTKIRKGLL